MAPVIWCGVAVAALAAAWRMARRRRFAEVEHKLRELLLELEARFAPLTHRLVIEHRGPLVLVLMTLPVKPRWTRRQMEQLADRMIYDLDPLPAGTLVEIQIMHVDWLGPPEVRLRRRLPGAIHVLDDDLFDADLIWDRAVNEQHAIPERRSRLRAADDEDRRVDA